MFYRIIFCIECHVINTNIVKYYSIYYESNWFGLMASKTERQTTSFKFCRLGQLPKLQYTVDFLEIQLKLLNSLLSHKNSYHNRVFGSLCCILQIHVEGKATSIPTPLTATVERIGSAIMVYL